MPDPTLEKMVGLFRQLQAEVDASVLRTGGYWSETETWNHVIEELGEMARTYRTTRPRPEHEHQAEMCDVLFTLLVIANIRKYDLGVAFTECLRKLDNLAPKPPT